MDLDENICLCFHVSLRKVKKFIRLEKPIRASQISQCYGAGTGCGWCRPFLKKLLAEAQAAEDTLDAKVTLEEKPPADQDNATDLETLSPGAYADLRKTYIESGHGKPPK